LIKPDSLKIKSWFFYLSADNQKKKAMRPNLLLLISSFLLLIFGCENQPPAEDVEEIIFENVSVIPMNIDRVLTGQSVVIREDTIFSVAPSTEVSPGSKSTVIDGTGKFIMPGIAEMHAHIPNPESSLSVEDVLFLYLSNGITTIRGMLGHPSHLQLMKDVKEGNVLGPTIFTSTPSFNGNTAATPELTDSLVRVYKTAGYDFIKIHPGVPLASFDKMVETANEVGIGFSGHVPVEVGIRHAIESGYGSIDHADGFIRGIVPDDAGLDLTRNDFFGMSFANDLDEGLIDDLVAMTSKNKVWVVPTQSLFDRWASPVPADEYASQPEMKYLPNPTIDQWVRSKNNLLANDYNAEDWMTFNNARKRILKALNDNGQGLLLGSDAPQVFNVPGFSIQHEMIGLVAAGISPFDVLRGGTLNVAAFFEQTGEFGQISKGAIADLILLDANPLENINAMKAINGVMVRGRWLDRAFIDRELEKIAEKNETN
jgi:hypothetical protein